MSIATSFPIASNSAAAAPSFGIPPLPVRRFTVDEYHKLIDLGILTENPPVELLEGWIVEKMTRKPPHDGTIDLLEGALAPLLPAGWFLRTQRAIATGDSEPEPDLAVVRGDRRTYLARHPGPADIGLVIEVSDSTLTQDRVVKGRLYARANITCYWIVNLVDRCIEVCTNPSGPTADPEYRTKTEHRAPDTITLTLDGQAIASLPVADLLP